MQRNWYTESNVQVFYKFLVSNLSENGLTWYLSVFAKATDKFAKFPLRECFLLTWNVFIIIVYHSGFKRKLLPVLRNFTIFTEDTLGGEPMKAYESLLKRGLHRKYFSLNLAKIFGNTVL